MYNGDRWWIVYNIGRRVKNSLAPSDICYFSRSGARRGSQLPPPWTVLRGDLPPGFEGVKGGGAAREQRQGNSASAPINNDCPGVLACRLVQAAAAAVAAFHT